jgi:hypothetical protein
MIFPTENLELFIKKFRACQDYPGKNFPQSFFGKIVRKGIKLSIEAPQVFHAFVQAEARQT